MILGARIIGFNMQVHHLFPTLVLTFDFSQHYQLDKALSIIDTTKLDEHGLLANGKSSWGSPPILDDPELFNLRVDIEKCVNQYRAMNGFASLRIANSWFNVMNVGGIVKPHRHEGSVVSGAFYIKADENSSNLVFNSPLKPYRMNDIVAENPTEYSSYSQEIKCSQGTLVLFPSWLEHETNENQSDTRTVISFNTCYV